MCSSRALEETPIARHMSANARLVSVRVFIELADVGLMIVCCPHMRCSAAMWLCLDSVHLSSTSPVASRLPKQSMDYGYGMMHGWRLGVVVFGARSSS